MLLLKVGQDIGLQFFSCVHAFAQALLLVTLGTTTSRTNFRFMNGQKGHSLGTLRHQS